MNLLTRDTAALIMDWLSVFDLVAWSRTCKAAQVYLHHFLQTRVRCRIPFDTSPKGLLCLWAEIRGDFGEPPRLIDRQLAFTATALARMVKMHGKNYAPPPNSSVGKVVGYERYPLALIATQYDPDVHTSNVAIKLKRRAKERRYRRIARDLLRKPLAPAILSLIAGMHNNRCWVAILRQLTSMKRPKNTEVRKVERYGAGIIVDAFMASRHLTKQHYTPELLATIRSEDVIPWMNTLVNEWIHTPVADYRQRSIDELLDRVAARRAPDIDEWMDGAQSFFERMSEFEWPLLDRMQRAIAMIDKTRLARRHAHFPPVNVHTVARFACFPTSETDHLGELIHNFIVCKPNCAQMRGITWERVSQIMQSIGLSLLNYFELDDKQLESTRQTVYRNPGLALFLTGVRIKRFPQDYLDGPYLAFMCQFFITNDEEGFHPWIVIKALTTVATELRVDKNVKTASALLHAKHLRTPRQGSDDDDERPAKRRATEQGSNVVWTVE